ncbi:hypothetical protein POTOM_060862 [Populus tomentosa]|uniref:Uncharacterized protein n=1 Tax=Populus tomentosa TaxID=118781 RepID=A0A8X7XU31_POPTO|nr:hypothetical protein POTOM_060857 [Populus tomentosa]KAG6736388.1 hypothetical protein POTOM_060862 [Populus tomentosa]
MWSMPAIEELKWNVDCSAFGKTGRTRIGGVLRDHKDSANVVNWMRDKSKRSWKFHDIFMRAARFMAVLKLVHYAHVLREVMNWVIGGLGCYIAEDTIRGCGC